MERLQAKDSMAVPNSSKPDEYEHWRVAGEVKVGGV